MIRHGVAPFLECSSKGDSRFSAFYARIKARDNKSIEDIYQAAKIFSDGSTNLSWKEAKGLKAANSEVTKKLYAQLWNEYVKENRHLIEVLVQASGLSDIYGQPNHMCQATELWRIRQAVIDSRQT